MKFTLNAHLKIHLQLRITLCHLACFLSHQVFIRSITIEMLWKLSLALQKR